MAWLLVLSFLTVCHVGELVSGLTVTSSKSIHDFTKLDLSENLQKYIRYEEVRLKVITGNKKHEDEVPLVTQRLQEFKSIQTDLTKNRTSNSGLVTSATHNHPTSVFAVIKNFVHAFDQKLSNKTKYGPRRLEEFLTKDQKRPFPTKDDLYRASAVVAFLRNIYNLSMDEMVKGNIKGHQGTPLNAADCHYIGKVSMEAKMTDDAEKWMRMALKGIDLTAKDVGRLVSFNVTDAMATLARILFTKEKRDEAIELLERATEIDSDNMQLHKIFLTHRYGKKVVPVENVEVDAVQKHFFELCRNLSLGKSIGKRKNEPRTPACRYKASTKTPYWRYREEIVNTYPFISIVHDFMGDHAIESLLEAAHEGTFREEPLPGGRKGQLWQSKIRTVHDFFVSSIADVSRRVGYVTGLGIRQKKGKLSLGEPVHFIDFGPGGTYSPHRDIDKIYRPTYMGHDHGTRLTTFHLFLSDTKEGGYLVFPELKIAIEPKKGMAVIVNNFKPSGIAESNLLVGICPVLVGQGKVLQKGIFTSGLDDNVLCGRKALSTHFSVEKARKCIAGPCGAPNTFGK